MEDKNWIYSNWSNVKQRRSSKIHEDLGKEASKFKPRRRWAFCTHAKSIFEESIITGWPQIASSKNWIQRLVKVLVFVLCVMGFVYQTLNFLHLYLSYPTAVNVHVSTPSEVLPPALTICNRNRRRRSVVCERNPKICSRVPTLCTIAARFCPANEEPNLMMVYPQELLSFMDFNWGDAYAEAHLGVIKTCQIVTNSKFRSCETLEPVPFVNFKGEPTYCVVLQTLNERPDEDLEYFPNTFSYEIELNTDPEEYLRSTEPVRMQIAVHDRRYLINPFVDGAMLDGGKQYICHVSMTQSRQLPDPYDTHCEDYLSTWKKNNGSGPLNQRSCLEFCKMNMALQTPEACVDQHVVYPHEENLCNRGTTTTTTETTAICAKNCHNACEDRSYQVQYEEAKDLSEFCPLGDEHCKLKNIKITVSFKRYQLTNYIYEPKFESVELYSYIGGYMGMWLGLSLVSLFDLFETIFKLVAYPFHRVKEKKKRKKVKPSLIYKGPMILGYY